ncbi:MAG: hypothetical protein ABIJ57_01435 [Pseudomonadota bacterium]
MVKQKLIGALIVFSLTLIGAGIGGSLSGYVRGVIAESRIDNLTAQMNKLSAFRETLHFEYVPRPEYEKDYSRLLKGVETLDRKLDKLLAREK